jgi:nitrite reductase/ring-hydroxylating ferredoxin subunit
LSNKDPFSQANVMARGIIGDLQGERVIASPIYKQHFSLATGRCLEDKDQKLLVFQLKLKMVVSGSDCTTKNLYYQQWNFTREVKACSDW